jgi:hypothetical protein
VRRALLAALGLVLLLAGAAGAWAGQQARSTWLPEDSWTATATVDDPGLALVTAPGVLEMRSGPVTVTATGDGPVVLALGRAEDVEAWLAGAPVTTVTGLASDTELATQDGVAGDPAGGAAEQPGEADEQPAEPSGEPADPAQGAEDAQALPDPAASDLWVQTASGEREASFVPDRPDGRWLVLAASDGTSPAPSGLTLTWQRDVDVPGWAVPLIVAGVLVALVGLAVLGVVALGTFRSRRAQHSGRHGVTW